MPFGTPPVDPSAFLFDGGSSGQSTAAAEAVPQNRTGISQADLTPSAGNPNQVVNTAQAALDGLYLQIPREVLPFYLQLDLATFTRPSWNEVTKVDTTSNIILPLPEQISARQNVEWEKKKLGVAGAAVNSMVNGNFNLLGGDALASGKAIAGKSGMMAADAVGGTLAAGVTAGALSAFGASVNDYQVLQLIGPDLRGLQFSWHFSAKTKDESTDIQTLYKTLSNAAAPSLGSGAASMFWMQPQCVFPRFYGPSGPLDIQLFAMKPCVITELTWNYTPYGTPVFYAGTDAPESVALTMTLIELTYWKSGDF